MYLTQGGGGDCDVASHPGWSRSTSSHCMLLKVEISPGLMGHLAHMETRTLIRHGSNNTAIPRARCFIKSQALGKLTGYEEDFVCLV